MKFKLHADFCKHPVYCNDSQLFGKETKAWHCTIRYCSQQAILTKQELTKSLLKLSTERLLFSQIRIIQVITYYLFQSHHTLISMMPIPISLSYQLCTSISCQIKTLPDCSKEFCCWLNPEIYMRTRYRYTRGPGDSAPPKVIYLSVVINHDKKLQLWSLC